MALHPDLHPLLAHMLGLAPRPPAGSQTPLEARSSMKARVAPLLAAFQPRCSITDIAIPTKGSGKNADLPLRLVRPPESEGALPIIVFFHGGGWVVCDNDTHAPMAEALAVASGAAVLMVDYALAPEHPFPAAIEDGLAALDWLMKEGSGRDLDTSRIALAGDSAGGNLAAVLARGCRDRGGPAIAAQYLIYPVIDLPDPGAYASYTECADYGLSAEDMAWYWSQYAGSAAPGPELLPLQADLAALPPALIHTAQFDVLRDEGAAYAAALTRAGVATSIKCWPGMIHGFLSLTGPLDVADRAAADAGAWLRAQLG
jgi:acetyl esterase